MQRLWDVERGAGSTTLRAETLDALGGAGQIVADHLERAIDALTPEQREIAARLFDHLVTPSGTKIAHEASDLAEFAGASEAEIRPVVETLANHRILRTDEGGRWEIFHDVLAGAVLGWKSRHDAERAVARAREESRRRHRRLGFLAFGALVGLALGVRARGVRPGAAERCARAGAGRDERAARRERAVARRQRPGARACSGAGGRTGQSESARRGCASPDARGLTRAGDLRRRPSARVARSRPIGVDRRSSWTPVTLPG